MRPSRLIGETVRYADFSGDQIDQAVLNHVIAGVADANNADPAGTAAVGSLARLRDESRQAKERLSAETATAVPVDLPGFASDVRLTRTELDNLIAGPLAGLLAAIGESLQRNNIAPAALAAVATVGGGAAIPLVTQRLSEQFRVPVITTPQSQLNVAAGAALLADQDLAADAPTGLSAAADAATGIAPSAWAAGAAGLAASESAADGAPSATHRALAWSQDDADAPAANRCLTPARTTAPTSTPGRPTPGPRSISPRARNRQYDAEPAPLPWYKRPPILFGAAAVAALLAIGGLAITLTGNSGVLGPVTETSTTFSIGPSSEPPPTSAEPTTVTVTGSDGAADDHHRHAATASAVVEHHHDDVSDDHVVHNDHHHDDHNDDHHTRPRRRRPRRRRRLHRSQNPNRSPSPSRSQSRRQRRPVPR